MLRILFSRLGQPQHRLCPTRSPSTSRRSEEPVRSTIERGGGKTVRKTFARTGGMCPRCEGRGSVTDFDLSQLYDDSKSLNEGALKIPGYSMDGWYGPHLQRLRLLDPDKPIRKYTKTELHDLLHKEPTRIKINGINLTYEGLISRMQKSILSKEDRHAAAARPRVRGAGGDLHRLPRVRRHPAQRGGPIVEDRRDQHRRRLRDADQRPRRMGPRRRRAVGGADCSRRCSRPSTRSRRSGWATSRSTGRRARCRAARRSASR